MDASLTAGHPVRIGLKVFQQSHPLAIQREVWQIADDAGFDHIWPYDHLVSRGDPEAPIYDGWLLLAAMAEVTTRTRLGLNVGGNLFRHPAFSAKFAVTVDHLSGGRLEMGIGAVRDEPQFRMFGLPFPGTAERIAMLDEACEVIKALWTQPRVTFAGRYYQLTDAIAEPKPVQRPHPPIWIGGSGPKLTMRVVARHADVWNSNAHALDDSVALSAILDEHCVAIGRDPHAIRRSLAIRMEQAEDPVDQARNAIDAGFTELLFHFGSSTTEDPRRNAEVAAAYIPRIRMLDGWGGAA